MMWLLLAACAAPGPEARLAALPLTADDAEIEAALAKADAAGVTPAVVPDLTGEWSIESGLPSLAVRGTRKRSQVRPGVFVVVSVIDTTRDGTVVMSTDFRHIEVFGDERVCSLALLREERFVGDLDADWRQTLRDGQDLAQNNKRPCTSFTELSADRLVSEGGSQTEVRRR